MGRRANSRHLVIWLNGIRAGQWDAAPGHDSFTYFDDWLHHPQGRPLSLSLPFTPDNAPYRGKLVSNWFDNLLPDSEPIRRRLAQRFRTPGTGPFELLSAVGQDCVGALQLLPIDNEPHNLFSIAGQALGEHDIAQLLRNTTAPATLGRDEAFHDLRLSIAGAQEKNALSRHEGTWLLPAGSTPTTHIFKLPLGLVGNMRADMHSSVENEWLCSKIVAAFGLPVAHCDIGIFDDQKALVVERFDRRLAQDGTWIIRLPQEDMCQAAGCSPLQKYQADGGPGITAIMDVLLGSEQAAQDRRDFFKTQLLFWLLAATDGHAKNFSIALLAAGRYRSTPLYDILSAHPILGKKKHQLAPHKAKLAMAIRGSTNYYYLDQIQRRHWIAMARQTGLGVDVAEQIIAELVNATPAIVEAMYQRLPAGFPTDVAEAILEGLRRQSVRLQSMPAA